MSSVIRMTGLISGLDTESIIAALVSAQSLKIQKVENKKTELTWKEEILADLNDKLMDFYDEVANMRLSKVYRTRAASSSNTDAVDVSVNVNAVTGTYKVQVNQLASAQYVTSGKITSTDGDDVTEDTTLVEGLGISSGSTITIGGVELSIDEDTTISDVIDTATSAGLTASFDEDTGRLFISSKSSGEDNAFTITGSSDALAALGLDEVTEDSSGNYTCSGTNSSYVAACDSEVVYNGATLNYSSNEFTLNGVTVTLKDETTDAVTISVTYDADAVYDSIKEFISSYNDLLEELNTYYYADSASDYEPLTDDEKESMSDDEIELWETTIKDSLLRRDSTVGSLITALKSAMQTTYTADTDGDGKTETYSLSLYGILTSTDYTEKGLLHIYGDEDDSTYSDEDDKLLAALQEDPDTVATVMTTIFQNLYKAIGNKTSYIANVRSSSTFYNDKTIDDQLDDYEDEIDDLEDKLSDLEDRYYEKFSAMETALATLQAQSSALSSLLG